MESNLVKNMKKIAILQSNYIPWKGYFDLIAAVDEFIIYDDVQYTKRDWRNRNKIKTPNSLEWLTIPVKSKGHFKNTIRSIEINDQNWKQLHWKTIYQNYVKSIHFKEISTWLEPLYLDNKSTYLSEINTQFILQICKYLKIETKISQSKDYQLIDGQTERLVSLCLAAKGNEYISGPSAKTYINTELFSQKNIQLTWFDYENYPSYPQLWGDFQHQVSILDLLFHCGKKSHLYMKYIKQ